MSLAKFLLKLTNTICVPDMPQVISPGPVLPSWGFCWLFCVSLQPLSFRICLNLNWWWLLTDILISTPHLHTLFTTLLKTYSVQFCCLSLAYQQKMFCYVHTLFKLWYILMLLKSTYYICFFFLTWFPVNMNYLNSLPMKKVIVYLCCIWSMTATRVLTSLPLTPLTQWQENRPTKLSNWIFIYRKCLEL